MATRASEVANRRSGSSRARVLGRSAVTGKFVLRPASKAGKLSMREARTAVVRALKKKH